MKVPNTHSPDFNVIGWLHAPPSDFALGLLQQIVDLSAELGVLVEVGEVGLGDVYSAGIALFLLHLVHFLVVLRSLTVVDLPAEIHLLVFDLPHLLHLFRSHHRKLLELLLHFLQLHLQQ